jgi:HEAT repeat protein
MDRLQALESLAKVKHPLRGAALAAAAGLAKDLADSDRVVLPLWAMAASGDLRALESLVGLLKSADVATRRRAAYALRRLRPESATLRAAILRALENEPPDTIAYPYLLCTALDLQLTPGKRVVWSKALRPFAATAAPKVKFEALQVLADYYGPKDLGALMPQLDDPDGDVRAGVALALFGIAGRTNPEGRREPL